MSADIDAMRAQAQALRETLVQFRADFDTVFKFLANGHISAHDFPREYAQAEQSVRDKKADAAWVAYAAAHFRQMAAGIERDIERSARIREEHRQRKERAA